MFEGIDVSRYQNPDSINWIVAAKTIQFVYAKACDSINPDPRFARHVAKAKEANLLTGGYHYLRVWPGQRQTAREQADAFCDIIEREGCELVPMLDCETDGNKGANDDEWLEAIRAFMDRCKERLNATPFLYTYPGFWASRKKLCEAIDLAAYPLWVAHYTTAPKPIVPKPWTTWVMWQYAAGAGNIGRVPGVPGIVDRDRLRVPLQEIMLHASRPAVVDVPQPQQSPVVVDEPTVAEVVATSTAVVAEAPDTSAIEQRPTQGSVTLPNTTPSGILGYILAFFRLIFELLKKRDG